MKRFVPLVGLLRETFASRESLADADTAQRIALTPAPSPWRSRQPWLVLGAAAAVVGIAGAGVALRPSSGPVQPFGPVTHAPMHPPMGVRPTATIRYHDEAAAKAQLLLADFATALKRVEPRAVSRDRAPAAPLRGRAVSDESAPGDVTLGPPAWWVVPAPLAEVAHRLSRLHPDGTTAATFARSTTSSSVFGRPTGSFTYASGSYLGTGTLAYSAPSLDIELLKMGDRTAVEADVDIIARMGRPVASHITGTVTSVAVHRDIQLAHGGWGHETIGPVAGTDRRVRALVRTLNGLPGALPAGYAGEAYCAEMTDMSKLTIVVHATGGDLTFASAGLVATFAGDPGDRNGCGEPSVAVTRAGKAEGVLDGAALYRFLARSSLGAYPGAQ